MAKQGGNNSIRIPYGTFQTRSTWRDRTSSGRKLETKERMVCVERAEMCSCIFASCRFHLYELLPMCELPPCLKLS